LVNEKSPFVLNEAIKTVRTNLLNLSAEESCPVYATVSAVSHAGKSVVTANLALSFAKLGKKVLLIDCDMRAPSQHRIFKFSNDSGIAELLSGADEKAEVVIRKSEYDNLYLITAGKYVENPIEILSSERFRRLMLAFRKDFDCVFLDLPPVGITSDALVLCDLVTDYLFVVRAQVDDRRAVSECVQRLKQSHAKIAGFILNDVNLNKKTYKRGFSYFYRNGLKK
jgi:capsular exopolysaccharide synthesis family protein